jgi:endonuclease/exonuclease/phosphatase family metal-dependent hydrolase
LLFLSELRSLKHRVSDKWLLIGDFNMILNASDKSNTILNRRLMGEFRDAVTELELKELNLQGRKYTWSNNRTQTRIDRAFCTTAWDCMLPGVHLQALSSRVSDHTLCSFRMAKESGSPRASGSKRSGHGCRDLMKW